MNPSLVLNRDNDLQQQFWPIFYFIKEQFWRFGELPLWNNLFFSGLPLLPDPQFSLFYPPNLLFLILPTNPAFIAYFIFHTFLGSIAIYLLVKHHFKLSYISSLFSAFIFIASPRLAGYLEAGHSGLVASWGLLPWILLAVFMLAKNPKYLWMVILAMSLAGVFFTHTVTFLISAVAAIILFGILVIFHYTKSRKKAAMYYLAGLLSTSGITAVSLLPQLEWTPQTTRLLLLQARDVYPKWASVKEFSKDILIPYLQGTERLWIIDTEKWLALGLAASLLALIGLLQLKNKTKIPLILAGVIIILISLNNASPIYKLLLKLDWYVLSRVATRVWFIPTLMVTILAGFGMEKLIKAKVKNIFICLIIGLTLADLLYLSWTRILKPLPQQASYIPSEIYQMLKNDSDRFRVFCIDRCFSQQEAAKANLELVEGYNTLQQTNYYKHMWQLSGGYWNYYTLALPPLGDFQVNKLQPDAKSLGVYNTKYVLSTYPLKDKNFSLEKQIGQFTIYRNNLFKTRAYFKNTSSTKDDAPIVKFSPNHIQVNVSKQLSEQVILAEVYSKGWKAYLNGKEETKILETPVSLRLINIKPDTKYVDFRYQPESFTRGKVVTLTTIFLLVSIPLVSRKYKI